MTNLIALTDTGATAGTSAYICFPPVGLLVDLQINAGHKLLPGPVWSHYRQLHYRFLSDFESICFKKGSAV